MRYVFLDTETTGLNPLTGDRVFEIGCVEVIDRKKTGKIFHKLLNPEKALSDISKQICKIEDTELVDKPLFVEIADQFLKFLNQDENTIIVAHNAKFDVKFINNELNIADKSSLDKFKIIDTLQIARIKFPGSPASLNALAKKFNIDLEHRESKGHGALLDSDLLADVFIIMCGDDDDSFVIDSNKKEQLFFGIIKRNSVLEERTFEIPEAELLLHKNSIFNF